MRKVFPFGPLPNHPTLVRCLTRARLTRQVRLFISRRPVGCIDATGPKHVEILVPTLLFQYCYALAADLEIGVELTIRPRTMWNEDSWTMNVTGRIRPNRVCCFEFQRNTLGGGWKEIVTEAGKMGWYYLEHLFVAPSLRPLFAESVHDGDYLGTIPPDYPEPKEPIRPPDCRRNINRNRNIQPEIS